VHNKFFVYKHSPTYTSIKIGGMHIILEDKMEVKWKMKELHKNR
jgi:hypothetical protein